jgi:DSBA-like thioredoxin domain
VASLAERDEVLVRWHPFQLNPQMPKAGISRTEYRTAKFGSWERSLALDAQLTAVGREEGIAFSFEKIERTPNTFDAHRLIWLADKEGVQEAVVEALFRAYTPMSRSSALFLSLLILFAGQSWCETLFGRVVGVSDGNSSPRAERITHAVWVHCTVCDF